MHSKKSSPTLRPFDSADLLPTTSDHALPDLPVHANDVQTINLPDADLPSPELLAQDEDTDDLKEDVDGENEVPQTITPKKEAVSDKMDDFMLNPPPPRHAKNTIEGMAGLLWSGGHLRTVLRDPSLFLRFTACINKYRPQIAPVLIRYLETQKAIKAVEYANAIAEALIPLPGDEDVVESKRAAYFDNKFKVRSLRAFDALVDEALPVFVTQALVKLVTESVVKEITGTQTPVIRDMIGQLAEVFCLTDPSLEDNPIVYASEGRLQNFTESCRMVSLIL